MELSLTGGGWTVGRMGKATISIRSRFRDSGFALDSVRFSAPACRITGKGTAVFTKAGEISYALLCSGSADSLCLFVPQCSGKLQFSGCLNGNDKDQNGIFTIKGKGLSYSDIPLGSADMTARIGNGSIAFNAYMYEGHGMTATAGGVLRQCFSHRPSAACTLSVRMAGAIRPESKGPAFSPLPDTISAHGIVNGWFDVFHGGMSATLPGPDIREQRGRPYRPEPRTFFSNHAEAGEQRTQLRRNSGRLHRRRAYFSQDTLVIDSLVVQDRQVVSGALVTKESRWPGARYHDRAVLVGSAVLSDSRIIAATCTFDVALKDLCRVAAIADAAVRGGEVQGSALLSGPMRAIESRTHVHLSGLDIAGIGDLKADAAISGSGSAITVRPFELRKGGRVVATVDTLANSPHIRIAGGFKDLDLSDMFGSLLPEDMTLDGRATGSFHSSSDGLPIVIAVASPAITVNGRRFDSVTIGATADGRGVAVGHFRACDGPRTAMTGSCFIPYSLMAGEGNETMHAEATVTGDLIATMHSLVSEGIDGTGRGAVTFAITGRPENWHVGKAELSIPHGTLQCRPWLPGGLAGFSCRLSVTDSSIVNLNVTGTVGKRPVRVFTSHEIPEGYKAVVMGPLDFGIIQIETPQHGVAMHLPGFMEPGEVGDCELNGKAPFHCFAISGPMEKLRITGIVLPGDMEFTFPLLKNRRRHLHWCHVSPPPGHRARSWNRMSIGTSTCGPRTGR